MKNQTNLGRTRSTTASIISYLLLLSLFVFHESRAQKFKPVPDQGMTNATHEKYVGQIVFSNERIDEKAPDESTFKKSFKTDEPLYGRVYMHRSVANEPVFEYYDQKKKKKPDAPCKRLYCKYTVKLFREGTDELYTLLCSRFSGEESKWTTLQLPINPASDDTEEAERMWVNLVNELPTGEHTFRVELWFGDDACDFNPKTNTSYSYVSDPAAVGSFTIVKEAGVNAKYNRTFESEYSQPISDPELESEMIAMANKYSKNANMGVTFSKVAITDDWEYTQNEYTGAILDRACEVAIYGSHPDEGCGAYPFIFQQRATGNGEYGLLDITYLSDYDKSGLDCSE